MLIFQLTITFRSIVQNSKGEFDRSQWPGISLEIKNNFNKSVKEQLNQYVSQLKIYQFADGKLDLYDGITGYLNEVNGFLLSCDAWADYIRYKGDEDYSAIDKLLKGIETKVGAMNLGYQFCIGLVKEYENSMATTGKYLTTMKAAKKSN